MYGQLAYHPSPPLLTIEDYLPQCPEPEGIRCFRQDGNGIRVTWLSEAADGGSGFHYEVRKRSLTAIDTGIWEAQLVYEGQQLLLPNLPAGYTQIQVRKNCDPDEHSAWIECGVFYFSADRSTCGACPLPSNGYSGKEGLAVGGILTVDGHAIVILSIKDNTGGFYTGTAALTTVFSSQPILVDFSNVSLAAKQLATGSFRAASAVDNNDYLPWNFEQQTLPFCRQPSDTAGFVACVYMPDGTVWNPAGFDCHGKYVKEPPYPGYQEGDYIDSTYNPNGFDANGIHFSTGTIYNEAGCTVNGIDTLGNPCNPGAQGPYYWVEDEIATEMGDSLYQVYKDSLRIWMSRLVTAKFVAQQLVVQAKRSTCDTLAGDMEDIVNGQPDILDRDLIFGENDEYLNEGMSTHFAAEPRKAELVDYDRDEDIRRLENLHVDLYHCDRRLGKEKILLNILDSYRDNDSLTTLLNAFIAQFRSLDADEISAITHKDSVLARMLAFLNTYYEDQFNSEYPEYNGLGFLHQAPKPLRRKPGFRERYPDLLHAPLYADAGGGLISNDLAEEFAFQFNQGWSQVMGYSRGRFLQDIFGSDALLAAPGGPVLSQMPIKLGKEIGGIVYEIYIDNIYIDANKATLDAYFIFSLPQWNGKIAFQAQGIDFCASGFNGTVLLELVDTVSLPINNVAKLNFGPNNYVAIDCEGFKEFQLDIDVDFCREYVVPVDPISKEILPEPTMAHGHFAGIFNSWSDILAELDMTPFAIRHAEEFVFELDSMFIDLNDNLNPPSIVFPAKYESPFISGGVASGLWTGFYARKIEVTLPPFFSKEDEKRLTVGARNLIIDRMGVTALFTVANILDIDSCNIGGWAASMDTFAVEIVNNQVNGLGVSGMINVPIFKAPGSNPDVIDTSDCFPYRAAYLDGKFNFAIGLRSNLSIPLLKGTGVVLQANSMITATAFRDSFFLEARLNGSVMIDASLGDNMPLKLDSIRFEGLVVRNYGPKYIEPGNWNMPGNINLSMGGFGIKVNKPESISNPAANEAGLHLGLGIDLSKSNLDIGGSVGLNLIGELYSNGNRQRWKFKRFEVTTVTVKFASDAFSLDGRLDFYRNHIKYGNGFKGFVDMHIKGLAAVRATAQFGQTSFRYFYVDAMVKFGKGFPIGATGLYLKAIGGGVWHHMSQPDYLAVDLNNLNELEQLTNENDSIPVGYSGGGVEYEPNSTIGLGIKFKVGVSVQKEDAFNAIAEFSLQFNSGGGVNEIGFAGSASFMQEMDLAASVTDTIADRGIRCALRMTYNFNNEEFNAQARIALKVNGFEGSGFMDLFFSKTRWHIYIGTPAAPVNMSVDVLGAKALVTAYLCLGTEIPAFPGVPPHVQSLTKSLNLPTSTQKTSGTAFATGASISFGGYQTFLIFRAGFEVSAGLDLMIRRNDPPIYCTNTEDFIGINNWYAQGQMWAYIKASVGLYFKKRNKTYNIMDLTAGIVLQAQLPNPLYMRGFFGGSYRILGGLIKGNCNFKFTVGEVCETEDGEGIREQIIASTFPEDGEKDVSLLVRPTVVLNVPIGETFVVTNEYGEDVELKAEIKKTALLYRGVNISLAPLPRFLNEDGTSFEVLPQMLLPGSDTLRYIVSIDVRRVVDNVLFQSETDTVTFVTAEQVGGIPTGNILATYPHKGQANFFRNQEKNGKCYIKLLLGQGNLAGDRKLYVKLKDRNNGVTELIAVYNDQKKQIEYAVPPGEIEGGEFYKVELWGFGGATQGGDELLYENYFRTSIHAVVEDKLAPFNNVMFDSTFVKTFENFEPFDRYEFGPGGTDGYVRAQIITDTVAWYKLNYHEGYYRFFTRPDQNLMDWRIPEELGGIPFWALSFTSGDSVLPLITQGLFEDPGFEIGLTDAVFRFNFANQIREDIKKYKDVAWNRHMMNMGYPAWLVSRPAARINTDVPGSDDGDYNLSTFLKASKIKLFVPLEDRITFPIRFSYNIPISSPTADETTIMSRTFFMQYRHTILSE